MKNTFLKSEVLHQLILNDKKDPLAQLLRHCPCIQILMLQGGYMDPAELTPEEKDRIRHIINLEDLHHD